MLAGMIGAGVMVAVIVFFSYYKVDTVEVRGTSHYTDEEVKNMVLRGPMASNSVLAPLLYSTTNTEDIAYVDAFKVTQLNRNTICISVKEKKTVGCIRYLDSYIYFDRNGIFVEGSQNRDETVPYFDGIQVNSIVMDEKLDIKVVNFFFTKMLPDKHETITAYFYCKIIHRIKAGHNVQFFCQKKHSLFLLHMQDSVLQS